MNDQEKSAADQWDATYGDMPTIPERGTYFETGDTLTLLLAIARAVLIALILAAAGLIASWWWL